MKLSDITVKKKLDDRVEYKPTYEYTLSSGQHGRVELITYWPEANEWNITTERNIVLIDKAALEILMVHKVEFVEHDGLELDQ